MITLNNHNYRVYLIDTNIISRLIKDKIDFGSILLNFILKDGIICFSPYTIFELSQAPQLYEEFKEIFLSLPTLLCLNCDQLIELEIKSYPNKEINICDTFIYLNKHNFNKDKIDIVSILDSSIKNIQFQNLKINMCKEISQIKNKKNLATLTRSNYYNFLEIEICSKFFAYNYIGMENIDFIQKFEFKNFNLNKFPSILTMAYIYYYKFSNLKRKLSSSDFYDILIYSACNYCDAIITENEGSNFLKLIQSKHSILQHIAIYNTKDILKIS